MHFEDVVLRIYKLYAMGVARSFPLLGEERGRWSNPDVLDWLAFGYEKEGLYLRFSCGDPMDSSTEVVAMRQILTPDERGECLELAETFDGFTSDWDTREALALCAAALAALRLDRERERIPMDFSDDFRLQVFDDIEDAEEPAAVPRFGDDANTLEMLTEICRTEPMLTTLLALKAAAGTPNLIGYLRRFSELQAT